MTKRIGISIFVVVLLAPLLDAQVPAKYRKAFPPEAKLGPKAAVTVIDVRDIAGDKKPPKRAMDAPFSLRMMTGSGTREGAPAAALGPADLGQALQQVGISLVPAGVYARFTPGQSSTRGKGYLSLIKPDVVFPDHADFTPEAVQGYPQNFNGPMVVLREPGTYSADFLVEFANVPVDSLCNCLVLIGHNRMQMKVVHKTDGAQHIVVVWTLTPEGAALPDERRSLGIYCYLPGMGQNPPAWTLYLVDVTKL